MIIKAIVTCISVGLIASTGFTQATQNGIDSSNYYDYYSDGTGLGGVSTDWLRESDVVPIISEALKDAGYEWIGEYCLFKLPSDQRIILSVYCKKSNFGFLYIKGHSAIPKKEHRSVNPTNINYTIAEYDTSGEVSYFKITEVPRNIFILKENCYWYQSAQNPTEGIKLVTKDIAISILKQDIALLLSMAPKL